ncbi:MAG: Zn-ribbon domain-containing OB-fold protein [Candidatus Kariarchaeaceae archaeon]
MSGSVLSEGIPYIVEKSVSMNPYWEGLNNGELKSTQCDKCQTIHYPPSPKLCTSCFGFSMSWINLPLEGTVLSHTKVLAPPEGFSGTYLLVTARLDKLDKTIIGRFSGDQIAVDDRVRIGFERVGDQSVLVFQK